MGLFGSKKTGKNAKENKKEKYYQIEQYTDKQVFHENIKFDEISSKLLECIEGKYKQVSAWSNDTTFDMKISKKGKIFLGKKKSSNEKLYLKGRYDN